MHRIFVPTTGPDDWRQHLADPQRQWKPGYSAYALAHCWEQARGFPHEIRALFTRSHEPAFERVESLLAFPEYPVRLVGGKRPSYNDLFVLAKNAHGELIAIAVEGKVSEAFGPMLGQWLRVPTPGKHQRLHYLLSVLGLPPDIPDTIHYQLLHRTASAVVEARRFCANYAVMLVHSFSPVDKWFEDYQQFVALFGVEDCSQELVCVKVLDDGLPLFMGWATGDTRFLSE